MLVLPTYVQVLDVVTQIHVDSLQSPKTWKGDNIMIRTVGIKQLDNFWVNGIGLNFVLFMQGNNMGYWCVTLDLSDIIMLIFRTYIYINKHRKLLPTNLLEKI